eukprot:s3940_g2.t1
MWVSAPLELQLAAVVRTLHEPADVADDAVRVEQIWTSLREAINNETEEAVGSKQAMSMAALAAYLTLKSGKSRADVENILHDEFTAVQELATWEEPMTEDGLCAPEDLGGQQTEEAMKEDLWEAVCQANRQDGSDVTLRRFGASRVAGLPILDPPTVQSRNQLIREDSPYYIAAGFLKLFPLGQGDYWAHASMQVTLAGSMLCKNTCVRMNASPWHSPSHQCGSNGLCKTCLRMNASTQVTLAGSMLHNGTALRTSAGRMA